MEVTIFELSKHLSVSPDTIERWIRQGKLPVSKKGNNYRFDINELVQWAKKNHIRIDLTEKKSMEKTNTGFRLSDAVKNGGIYSHINGDDVHSVLSCAIEAIPGIPAEHQKSLLDQLIKREAALSTGIGNGVAIPHPRQPQAYLEEPMAAVCFLSEPVDYNALDGQAVFVLFLILCPDLKIHLQLLSALSFCLKHSSFVSFLKTRPAPDALLGQIEDLQNRNSI